MDQLFVYILWSYNADSWNSVPQFKSLHKTLESADAEVPENLKTPTYTRALTEKYVRNYTYFMIEKREVKD